MRTLLAAVLCLGVTTVPLSADEFHVDNTHPSCSDTGPGTEANPYCTISAAMDQQRDPGTTFLVHPGRYPEQVTVPASGDSINRIVIRALGTAIVDGADDFSDPNAWQHHDEQVWVATDVTWAPQQVFLDGARLTLSEASPANVSPGEFLYVDGDGLYVSVGGAGSKGDNPGDHDLRVGRRLYGFRMSARSWITVDGFTVMHTENKGIYVQEELRGVTVTNNTVTRAGAHGIAVVEATKVLVASNVASDNADHGIAFVSGVSGSTIEDNESFGNARPGTRAANGIYLFASTDNLIQRNRLHDNQDSGLQLARDSDDNVSLQNVSWSNGDHGFDCVDAVGTIQIGNVAWGNERDGFSLEGGATQTTIVNCIAIENGVNANRFDLFVDPPSLAGFASDYNIFWNSTSQDPIKVDGIRYATIAAFAAVSGTDARSIQADALFVDPAGGDLHLQPGSPAIDSGDSSPPLWPEADADGLLRFDDPSSFNSGNGPVPHSDRGAYEYFVQALAVGDGWSSASGVQLSSAYPNPSASGVALNLELARAARVTWSVHDLQGRTLRREVEARLAGRSIVRWNGVRADDLRALPGLYFIRVVAGDVALARPVVLMN